MEYDIIVIGSGPGGYTAALEAAKYGKKVAIIEKDEIGGVCLNRGCIPTKTIIESVNLYAKMKRAGEFGLSANGLSFDWQKIIDRKNKVVSKLQKGLEFLFKKAGIEVIKGEAHVKESGLVEVNGKEIKAGKIIIATGTTASKLKGFESGITSDEAVNLKELPKEITIIGAGAVGVEFAYIFNALGVKVTLLEMMPHILPSSDEDISKSLQQILTRKGIEIKTSTKADPALLAPGPLSRAKSRDWTLSTGRSFNKISVNNHMQTSELNTYAIGDVTGISMYAHSAIMQGLVAAKNACGIEEGMDYSAVPSCIFCGIEAASVGLTEKEANAKGLKAKTSKFNFAALGRSSASGEIEGFVKLIAEEGTGKILGCHILGNEASNLLGEATLAIKKGLTVKDIAETIHAHPTLPEALWEAARLVEKG